MAVVEEVLQCIIEPIERHDCPHLIVHQLHGRLFEQSQHGTFTFGQVLAGCTVGTDAGQHAGKQIKLVWNKRINLCKVFCVGVQFFLHAVVEDNQIFDDGCFLVIEQTQALCCGLSLIQNTLFDNSVHIGRGQRKTCIETSLNLGEVVTLHLGNGVDILLARYDYPSLTHAFLAQFFRHCLKVQHQFGIITNVLANLIYKENHMVVVTFFLNIGLYTLGEILNTDLVALGCFLTPVTSSRFAHEIHVRKNIDNGILNEIEVLARAFPRISILFFKLFLKLFKTTFLGKPALQVSKVRHGAAKALHLIEDLQEYVHNGIFIFFAIRIAFGINVEKNYVRWGVCRQLHICQHHLIGNLLILNEVVDGMFVSDLFILKQIGQDFQEMRFTTSKEAGNPDTHFRCGSLNTFFICCKEICKMTLKLTGHNILFQLLRYICFFTLTDNDNALYLTVNFLSEHVLDLHNCFLHPLLYQSECPVIVIVFNLIEQNQLLFIIGSRKEHHDRAAHKCLMQVVKHLVGAQNRIALADAGQEHDCILRRMFFDILHDQAVIVIYLHGVGHCLDDTLDSSLFFKVIALLHEVLLFQKVNDDIIQVKDHKLKIIIAPVVLIFQILYALPNFQFLFRWIIKHPIVDLICAACSFSERWLMDCKLHLIQSLA